MQATLERFGYSVETASDGTQALRKLDEPDIQVVITDWVLSEMEGLELCRQIREKVQNRYVYIILLTARSEKTDIVRGIEAGADDYLIKPVGPDELKVRLRAAERIIGLERRLREVQQQLVELAAQDSLTGLLNRRALFERLSQETERAKRQQAPLSILLFDIDHFKRINDTYGHITGDKVIASVALRAKKLCRTYDILGRYGGEEFVVVLPGCCIATAEQVAERIRKALDSEPIQADSENIVVTASFGVTEFSHMKDTDRYSIFRRADGALYRAKQEGRNRVCTVIESPES
jgi:two-component system chemotaxis response regulator CheY